jgi:hypothetical protein
MTSVLKYAKEFRPCVTQNTVPNTNDSRLMLFGEIITVYSENHMQSVNTFYGKETEIFSVKECRPYSNRGMHKSLAPSGPSD